MFEQNDIFETTTIFTIFENLTEISFTNFTEETDSSSMTSIFFNESTAYSETIEERDYNISTSTNTISSIITEDYNEIFPTKTKEFITLSSISSQINDTSEYSVITTLNTNTEYSMNTITFNRESSIESTDKISTIDRSSTTLREGVIPLSEKDYVTRCFEKICTTTTQNTSINKV